MNDTFESVQARMRFFYETEKERIRSDALTDFTDIDYVMFVVKGPLCLRGKVLDFEEGENLHVKAIDFGFEMKVKKFVYLTLVQKNTVLRKRMLVAYSKDVVLHYAI